MPTTLSVIPGAHNPPQISQQTVTLKLFEEGKKEAAKDFIFQPDANSVSCTHPIPLRFDSHQDLTGAL